ncbi:MAG: DUF3795 domain-containing protein [Dehalococcoidia bacterium]
MDNKHRTQAFENVRGQIGYCGIWCGSCVVGNGALRALTRRYKELITAYGLEEWGPKDFDHRELLKGLESIENVPLCSGCLQGGGRESCEMRSCAEHRKISGCHACGELVECKHSELLSHMRSGAIKAGLFVSTEDVDRQQLIENWTARLRTNWLASLIFAND